MYYQFLTAFITSSLAVRHSLSISSREAEDL